MASAPGPHDSKYEPLVARAGWAKCRPGPLKILSSQRTRLQISPQVNTGRDCPHPFTGRTLPPGAESGLGVPTWIHLGDAECLGRWSREHGLLLQMKGTTREALGGPETP